MRVLLFFLIQFCVINLYAHDIALATYHLSQGENQILIEISIDKLDLEKSIQAFAPGPMAPDKESGRFRIYIERYLDQHLAWEIDGAFICHEIQSIQKDEEYYRIKAILPGVHEEPNKIRVHNDCLVSEIKNHSNVIYAHFYGKTRGFRLHQKRKVAIIDYN